MKALKDVLAFLLTMIIGIGAGSVIATFDEIDPDKKKRSHSHRMQPRV